MEPNNNNKQPQQQIHHACHRRYLASCTRGNGAHRRFLLFSISLAAGAAVLAHREFVTGASDCHTHFTCEPKSGAIATLSSQNLQLLTYVYLCIYSAFLAACSPVL